MASYGSVPDLISSSVTVDIGKGYVSDDGMKQTSTTETIYPFVSPQKSFIRTVTAAFHSILRLKETKKILVFLALNVFGTATLLVWCHDTNSMALTAYTYLTIFDLFR
ncbi:zinc transporter 6-B-like [Mercenaria mercenaria]|uniref:zinc transporter 6-B-like n=1 Tax=Mercenaria mercenaria TaxID=6596 RepID=UPI00234EDA9C|nr:zinc transporter 6-B-like [Mercenaria mercenaria]